MMKGAELERFSHLVGVYRSTVNTLPHPADDLVQWRRRWTQVQELATELDRRLDAHG